MSNTQQNELIQVNSLIAGGGVFPCYSTSGFLLSQYVSDSWQLRTLSSKLLLFWHIFLRFLFNSWGFFKYLLFFPLNYTSVCTRVCHIAKIWSRISWDLAWAVEGRAVGGFPCCWGAASRGTDHSSAPGQRTPACVGHRKGICRIPPPGPQLPSCGERTTAGVWNAKWTLNRFLQLWSECEHQRGVYLGAWGTWEKNPQSPLRTAEVIVLLLLVERNFIHIL